MTPKDISLWKRLAYLSAQVGYIRQSIHCYSIIIKKDKDDLIAHWDRALLFAEINETSITKNSTFLTFNYKFTGKAIQALEWLEKRSSGNPEIAKILAKLYNRTGFVEKAIRKLESYLENHQDQADLTHINILADLYIYQVI